LEVDPASKWTFKIAGFPVAVALDQHYLRSLQLDKNKAVLRPLICEPKTKNIAPERFALGQIKSNTSNSGTSGAKPPVGNLSAESFMLSSHLYRRTGPQRIVEAGASTVEGGRG